jgi:diguanylate cyclase (GGDEF)-like protein
MLCHVVHACPDGHSSRLIRPMLRPHTMRKAASPAIGAGAGADRPRAPGPAGRLRGRLAGWLAIGFRGRWAAATTLLFVLGTLASYLGARSLAHSDSAKARLQFHLSSAQVASTLQLAIQREEDLTVAGSAHIARNPGDSASQFDGWVEAVRAMQRYPELQSIGFVVPVGRSQLGAFEARRRANPLHPFGMHAAPSREAFQILPPGERPLYCFAEAGLTRNHSTYQPVGLDYCALAPALLSSRETGRSSYAPFVAASTTLGVETPVYRGGRTPAGAAARRRAFVGWLGELLEPDVVVKRALQGHQRISATVRYASGSTNVAFTSGPAAVRGGERTTVSLHNGWSVETFEARPAAGIFQGSAELLFLGGSAVSLLLALLALELGTSRRRALALVSEKTRELTHQALHDTLTGLPNRALVLDRAEQLLARASRQPELLAGALFVDVDGFKHVNDELGHAAGDQLLRIVGERLHATVREQDTVGRLGGDEFVVLVETHERDATAEVLADRLIEELRRPVPLGDAGRSYSFTASVGVAAGRYTSPDELLRDADLALYAAKSAGKDRYVLFESSMSPEGPAGFELGLELNAALWEEQLFLDYQPIYSLADETIPCAEALLRWRHPARGELTFGDFAEAAEESGLIVAIGRWALEQACRQAAAWKAAGSELGVSVNISASQLIREEFRSEVRTALARAQLEPSSLTIEVSELTLMREVTLACDRLEELKALGVVIAIDDFGTGYTSLAHLQHMPADVLKIDASFIAALGDGGPSKALLEAIMGVAHALELRVIAEGVETRSQLEVLRELGCEMAQGYLLARPCLPEALGTVPPGTSEPRESGSRVA